nr:serine hydrolase domain-containing protein [Sphingomonas sp. Y57]
MTTRRFPSPTERFQALLDDYVGILGNLGAIAAIEIDGGERLYFSAGFADHGRSVPASASHHYQVGSQSKTVVAITMLLLARAGQVDLDRSVRAYVDLPIDARITVRHLLMNQSGLGEMTSGLLHGRWDPRIAIKPRDLVAIALPYGQLFEPGAQFDYCNTGWVIAVLVIEAICARPYGEVVAERLLGPLGLDRSHYGGATATEHMLRGYLRTAATGDLIDTGDALSWAYGAGDGIATLDDMLTLFGSLLRAGSPIAISLADLTEQLGEPSAQPFFAMSAGTRYGLGIEQRGWAGSRVWGHPGSTVTYMSGTWIDPVARVAVSSCVTRAVDFPLRAGAEFSYPREQLFAMALNTAYALADRAVASAIPAD